MLFINCYSSFSKNPEAKNGVLDLQELNFSNNDKIILKGEWKFKWNQDSTEFYQSDYDDSHWVNFSVPGKWRKNKHFGYAWLRLHLKVPTKESIGILIKDVHTSYVIYVNGEKVASCGIAGNNKQSSHPNVIPKIIYLKGAKDYYIAVKISNFSNRIGGFRSAPIIGNSATIDSLFWRCEIRDASFFGLLFLLALHHFLLWLGRRKNRANILFSICCMVFLARCIATNYFFERLFISIDIYYLKMKIEYLSITVGWTIFSMFYRIQYPEEFNKFMIKIVVSTCIVFSLFVLATPLRIYWHILLFICSILIIISFWVLVNITRASLKKREYAIIILTSLVIFIFTVFHDILYKFGIINSVYISGYGMIIIILSQSIVLSLRYSKTFRRAEYLSENLKKEVDKQTLSLNQKNLELIEANTKIKELDRFKTTFFQNITHEFRTPLTLVMGPLEELKKYVNGKNQGFYTKQLSLIGSNTKRLLNLINQLLDLSKLDEGRMKCNAKPIDIINCIRFYIESFESAAKRKGVKLRFCSAKNSIVTLVDPEKFERIIFNLLSNALKFTKDKIDVLIDIKPDDTHKLEIKVRDNGIGIEKQELNRVFDRFQQTNNRRMKNVEGSGIGLSLVKEFVNLHKGKIYIESEPSKGTSFVIHLPYSENNYNASEIWNIEAQTTISALQLNEDDKNITQQHNNKKKTGINKISILIVEDNPDMCIFISEIFSHSFDVQTAEDGKAGYNRAIYSLPDLIVSDIMMPKMNGIDMMVKLKNDKRTSHIPIVLLTAKADIEDQIQGLETGADDYVAKPFRKDYLFAKVNNLIEIRKKIKEKYITSLGLEPNIVDLPNTDGNLLKKATKIIEQKMEDPKFSIDELCRELGLSRIQFYRKLKSLLGMSPSEFIMSIRSKAAYSILKNAPEGTTIQEVVHKTGFYDTSHFVKRFKKQFNQSPSEFLKKQSKSV